MSERYIATFDSLAPMRGVVVDEDGGRYCTFPSLEKAQDAAGRWNQPPLIEFDPPMVWRSIDTGERVDGADRVICDHRSYYVNDDGEHVCLVCGRPNRSEETR